MRAVLGGIEALGGDVIDLVLAFLHAGDVIGQRNGLLIGVGMGGGETQQSGDLVLVGEVFADAFLQHLAELAPELGVFFLVILGQIFQHAQHLAGAALADRLDVLRLLQYFARHVQRQVGWNPPRRARSADMCGISCSASSMMNTRRT